MSPEGVVAEGTYRDAVQTARTRGRIALEIAQLAWAEPLGVQPGDGVVLGELRNGKKSIAELSRALEDCGTTQLEVKAAIDRLSDAHLVEPAPLAQAA
jgi:hypothetical protein